MQTQQRVWNAFQQDGVVRFVVKVCLVAAVGLCFTGAGQAGHAVGSHAQSASECSTRIRTDKVVGSDGGGRAARAHIDQATSGPIANPDLRYTDWRGCDPLHGRREDTKEVHISPRVSKPVASVSPARPVTGRHDALSYPATTGSQATIFEVTPSVAGDSRNVFPYGTCTWWANQRYRQLHGIFVPWRNNANAWQWVARANDFGWHVSSKPTKGSIIVLQGGVQGASALGHVGVVEQVRPDGSVVVSSMSWGSHPLSVTTFEFHPGPGVAFVSQ